MGGKALKNTETIRLEKDSYFVLQDEVLKKLENLHRKILPIKAYKNKKNFGDMDILITTPKPDYQDLKKFLEQTFNTKEIVKNGDVISFEYNSFQIDLVFVNEPDLETAEFYFSYNDLNNMIGKIAYAFGLKFGFDGLYYPLRTKHGNLYDEILLTKNPNRIYDFLQYDYKRYLQGFNELSDIFTFIVSGKYFTPEKYLKGHSDQSLIDRRRTKKRKTYIEFLNWLENYVEENHDNEYFQFNKDKSSYINLISDFFPESNLLKALDEFEENQKKQEEVNKKFNGKVVMTLLPELKGKELGEFIIKFKKKISENNKIDFEDSILEMSSEKVKNEILNYWNEVRINGV